MVALLDAAHVGGRVVDCIVSTATTTAPPGKARRPGKRKARSWKFTAAHLAPYPQDDPARAFAEDVVARPHLHNRWVHLACRRHALDLAAAGAEAYPFFYDIRRAVRPSEFAKLFCGLEGPLAGKPLDFLPWQRFVTAQLFGWRRKDDPRKRRFRYSLIKVPRKNGKTGFVAPLGLFQLSHPPPNARCEVYSVATKEDIAKIVLKDGMRLIRTNGAWANQFRPRHKSLTHGATDSEWKPLGSDSDTLDGLRPELVVMDELHAWKDRALWDVLNSAFGAAFSPLIVAITTSGKDESGLLKEQENRLTAVLESVERGTYTGSPDGSTADEGLYAGCIWTVDTGDKWDSLDAWHKANPSLGVVKDIGEMRTLVVGARSSTGARRDFLVKQLNIDQTTGPKRWLDMDHWEACAPGATLTPAATWARLRGLRVWGGLDLASTTDTSSFCAIADDPDRPGGILAAWLYWLPDEDLAGRCARDHVPYDLWSREGWMSLTAGPVVDVNQIERDIVAKLADTGAQVESFAYDPGWAQGAGQRLQDEHALPMVQCPQRYSTLTAPLAELERTVIAHLLDHGAHPIAHAHARAATVKIGATGGMLLAKGHSTGRIDGIAALAMAFAARQASLALPATGAGVMMV
jgi:phage terminase large subunit-like protein